MPESTMVVIVVEIPAGIPGLPEGVVLVKETDPKRQPAYWKFPGGEGDMVNGDLEEPETTAVREVLQETGIIIDPDELILLYEKEKTGRRGKYVFYAYQAIAVGGSLLETGDEGEIVRVFSKKEVQAMGPDKFFKYYDIIRKKAGLSYKKVA